MSSVHTFNKEKEDKASQVPSTSIYPINSPLSRTFIMEKEDSPVHLRTSSTLLIQGEVLKIVRPKAWP